MQCKYLESRCGKLKILCALLFFVVPIMTGRMETVVVDGITLEYEVAGTGDAAIFIHGAFIADAFRPLLFEPVLADHYQLILYHRRGYGGSGHSGVPVSIAQQAADCRAVLRHLGVARAHVVGHSLGGCIALQFTLDAPAVVQTLALLEPALIAGATGHSYREAMLHGQQRYREVPPERLIDESLQARYGAGYRTPLERILPGAFEQAVAHAGTVFELDLPGWLEWRFGEHEAKRITQPVLAVTGSESNALWPRFGETHRLLLQWFTTSQGFVLPGAAHGLQLQNPRGMAGALADFWAHHPIG
ncbi:MAG TPA: alpha/beta hydrolase [Methanomicrobia archaeon]|nr:alpha/beta hydrolase [Methanomicrobia archaeon]